MLEKIVAALSAARSQHAAEVLGTTRRDPEPTLFECGRVSGFYQGLAHAEALIQSVVAEEESRERDEPDFKP